MFSVNLEGGQLLHENQIYIIQLIAPKVQQKSADRYLM